MLNNAGQRGEDAAQMQRTRVNAAELAGIR